MSGVARAETETQREAQLHRAHFLCAFSAHTLRSMCRVPPPQARLRRTREAVAPERAATERVATRRAQLVDVHSKSFECE